MKPTRFEETADSTKTVPLTRPLGFVTIAKVTYENHPLHLGENSGSTTIGDIVDQRIAATLAAGALISEVRVNFESQEQQHEIANFYANLKMGR